jgi:hypothetical protein
MRPKQFFYVCAGVLMLGIAYQLSIDSAQAGSEQVLPFAIDASGVNTPLVLMSNADIMTRDIDTGTWHFWTNPLHAIGGDHIVLGFAAVSGRTFVLLENGDVWVYASTPQGEMWINWGNVHGGTINVEDATITDIKRNYREEE